MGGVEKLNVLVHDFRRGISCPWRGLACLLEAPFGAIKQRYQNRRWYRLLCSRPCQKIESLSEVDFMELMETFRLSVEPCSGNHCQKPLSHPPSIRLRTTRHQS